MVDNGKRRGSGARGELLEVGEGTSVVVGSTEKSAFDCGRVAAGADALGFLALLDGASDASSAARRFSWWGDTSRREVALWLTERVRSLRGYCGLGRWMEYSVQSMEQSGS